MQDKLIAQIELMLHQTSAALTQVEFALLVLREDPQLMRDLQDRTNPISADTPSPEVVRQYMAGRWVRRDGTNVASVAASVEIYNANHPTGHLRPPHVSGDRQQGTGPLPD